MITKKTLPRRTFLRGVGSAAIALPFLDAMAPAFRRAPSRRGPGAHGVLLCAERHDHGCVESDL